MRVFEIPAQGLPQRLKVSGNEQAKPCAVGFLPPQETSLRVAFNFRLPGSIHFSDAPKADCCCETDTSRRWTGLVHHPDRNSPARVFKLSRTIGFSMPVQSGRSAPVRSVRQRGLQNFSAGSRAARGCAVRKTPFRLTDTSPSPPHTTRQTARAGSGKGRRSRCGVPPASRERQSVWR
jgi:hypothetical protein